jgi:hypothetical protein
LVPYEIKEYLFTEGEYKERYSEDTDTLKEAKHYNDLQRIINAGINFWTLYQYGF